MKKIKTITIPDLTEYTDDDGKKWIQTSTEDLFSMTELNDIIESIGKERDSGEVVLARIDFQRVNKEYYDATITLQKKLKKQAELLQKVVTESKSIIDKKNKKLKELIDYIKKLHAFIAYMQKDGAQMKEISIPASIFAKSQADEYMPDYEHVEEVILSINPSEKDLPK